MTENKPKSPRWMKIALGISLCVNLLVLGAVGGALLGGGPSHRATIGNDPMRGLFRALPREERQTLRKTMDSRAANRVDRKAWTDDLLTALRAQDLDAGALQTLLLQRSERMNTIATNGHAALISILSEMSQADRLKLADDFEKGWKKRRNKRP